MFRIAIVLAVALLLAHSALNRISPPRNVPDAPAVTARSPGIVAGRPVLPDVAVLITGERTFPPDPPPFDLSESTARDPRDLAIPTDQAPGVAGALYRVEPARAVLRAGPADSYAEVATLARGSTVIASGRPSDNWLWVRTRGGGVAGYIATDRLSEIE